MSKRIAAVTMAAAVGVLIGALVVDRPQPAQAAGGDGGRYQAVASQGAFVMVDTQSGTGWITFAKQVDNLKYAWFPVQRLDTKQQVQAWRLTSGKD